MPSLRKERVAAVDTLTKDFDGLQGLVVAGYVGVKTQELNELRGKLRPLQARCQIGIIADDCVVDALLRTDHAHEDLS